MRRVWSTLHCILQQGYTKAELPHVQLEQYSYNNLEYQFLTLLMELKILILINYFN